jgi:hypothetical protein
MGENLYLPVKNNEQFGMLNENMNGQIIHIFKFHENNYQEKQEQLDRILLNYFNYHSDGCGIKWKQSNGWNIFEHSGQEHEFTIGKYNALARDLWTALREIILKYFKKKNIILRLVLKIISFKLN